MVGGVSIGAFMGALWCQERNVTTLTQKAREWSIVRRMNILFKKVTNSNFVENDTMVETNFGSYLSDDINVQR